MVLRGTCARPVGTQLHEGDQLTIIGEPETIRQMAASHDLEAES